MFNYSTWIILAIQISMVAIVGIGASVVHRRLFRSSGALPLVASVLGIGLLTLCMFNSWPCWFTSSKARMEPVATSLIEASDSPLPEIRAVPQPIMAPSENLWDQLANIENWIVPEREVPATPNADSPSLAMQVFSWMSLVLIVGFSLGVLRFVGGIGSVAYLVRTSRPIMDLALRKEVEQVAKQLGCNKVLEIRECTRLGLAATVGWRKPVLLLSPHWKRWSRMERQSLLAHEIAHIRRGDYLTTLLAQVVLLFHFYHPLVHWLTQRLRLEQEMAADAMAASLVGGHQSYLRNISGLALAQSREPLGWPAHPFLPTRRTFLRRMEMLRDLKIFAGGGPLGLRWVTISCIVAVSIVAMGIRSPRLDHSSTASAQEKPQASVAKAGMSGARPLVAKYVPEDADSVVCIQADALIEQGLKLQSQGIIPAELSELKQMSGMVDVTVVGYSERMQFGVYATFTSKEVRDAFSRKISERELHYPDDRSTIWGDEAVVKKMIATNGKAGSPLVLSDAWKKVSASKIAAAARTSSIQKLLPQQETPAVAFSKMFSPMWESAREYYLSANVADNVQISISAHCKDESDASKVMATVQAMTSLAINSLEGMKSQQGPNAVLANSVLPILSKFKPAQEGNTVRYQVEAELVSTLKSLVAPVLAARKAAQRQVHANNMKQVMLALHLYHDQYQHLPPAVIKDPDSGMLRSWRVELLPLLGYEHLYQQYRKNEAWDSEANMKVLKQIPLPYKQSGSEGGSNFTGISAAYGNELFFKKDDSVGRKFTDITDGTSNTIALIESKTTIPWTKPEEIALDLDKLSFAAMGGFDPNGANFGFADGSVRFLSSTLELKMLRALLTATGGEVIRN